MLIDDELGLYVVADGMGGHRAGEVASRIVVESMRESFRRFKEGNPTEDVDASDSSLSVEANRIIAGINESNRLVHDAASNDEAYQGMGSTVSVLAFTDDTLIAANVGDSPIYLIHKGKIELLSQPHTVMAEHAAIDPEGAQTLAVEFRHMLTRAMGTEATVKANICETPFFKDDIMIISSDGLSDLVAADEILEIATRCDPQSACRELVDLANDRGGVDNITVIVLKVKKIAGNGGKMKSLINRVADGLSSIKSKKDS